MIYLPPIKVLGRNNHRPSLQLETMVAVATYTKMFLKTTKKRQSCLWNVVVVNVAKS